MGDAGFARYEAFELAKPYRREADLIEQYAAQQPGAFDAKSRPRLVELLQEFQLHTTETWDGPYDPAPRPLAGTGPVVASLDETTSRIAAGLPGFAAKATNELPSGMVRLVDEYYAAKLREFAESRVRASMTRDERMAEMKRVVEETRLKAKARQGRAGPDL